MIYLEEQEEKEKSLFDTLYVVFLRLMAMAMIGVTVYYWFRMIGYYEGAEYKFATMSTHWKIASLTMAVLAPVAAVGLWMLTPWGGVVAIMLAFVNLMMFVGMQSLFGFNFIFLVLFLVVLCGLIAFHVSFWWRNR